MARGAFVTGTDTGVGKTVVAVAMLRALAAAGVRAVGMKPVSAGLDAHVAVNADVAALAAASNVEAAIADRNPYSFARPIAPHLAADEERCTIRLSAIRDAYARLANDAEVVVVEGAGGALVPLDDRHDMLDIARELALPVVLVVGVRLGCIHQARSTVLAIRARGVRLAGWVATRIDPAMAVADENVAWLARELAAPLLADFRTPATTFPRDALLRAGLAARDAGGR